MAGGPGASGGNPQKLEKKKRVFNLCSVFRNAGTNPERVA